MPKAFKFSLQKVLDYRKNLEDLQAVALQKSVQEKLIKQQQLMTLNKTKETAITDKDTFIKKSRALKILELQVSSSYLNELNLAIDKKTDEIIRNEKRCEKERQKLLKLSREKKIVENLQERKLLEYIDERKKKDTKEESEIALRIKRNSTSNKEDA